MNEKRPGKGAALAGLRHLVDAREATARGVRSRRPLLRSGTRPLNDHYFAANQALQAQDFGISVCFGECSVQPKNICPRTPRADRDLALASCVEHRHSPGWIVINHAIRDLFLRTHLLGTDIANIGPGFIKSPDQVVIAECLIHASDKLRMPAERGLTGRMPEFHELGSLRAKVPNVPCASTGDRC